jgi:dTDP-4-dehydrorhamnose reductase
MRVLILGGSGMLGHKLLQTLEPVIPETYATLRDDPSAPRYAPVGHFATSKIIPDVTIASIEDVRPVIERVRPDVLINCIGIIKQRGEAKAAIPSITFNALFPHQLAESIAPWRGRLIHFSTDCVFNGRRGNYREEDVSDAEDLYGRTKFLGEVTAAPALTLRTSIIGRELDRGDSLLEWFLAQDGKRIKGFKHAIYAGVTTNHLARVVRDLVLDHPTLAGLYQVTSEPISKYDLLQLVKAAYGADIQIDADEAFHCDRSMIGDKFVQATGIRCPAWPALVQEMAADPTPYRPWRQTVEGEARR